MIKIIDYGLGNIQAFLNTYKTLDIPAESAKTVADLKNASHLILPGVGSFDQAIKLFNNSGMRDEVESLVLKKNIPILGVCVGMQILGDTSDEGCLNGLGWIEGRIKKIRFNSDHQLPLPHMGWNEIKIKNNSELFFDLDTRSSFYFLHSYHFYNKNNTYEIANVLYGSKITCAVKKNNIFGVQFHPEKSHLFGAKLLKNFSKIKM